MIEAFTGFVSNDDDEEDWFCVIPGLTFLYLSLLTLRLVILSYLLSQLTEAGLLGNEKALVNISTNVTSIIAWNPDPMLDLLLIHREVERS